MANTAFAGFLDELKALTGPGEDAGLLAALDATVRRFGCVVGTIHDLDPATGMLRLRVHRGIPEAVLERVRVIPIGKGMAGLAAERREPVQICNLQTDDSGQAKPAARLTGMEGSISFPMIVGGELKGAMGVAKPVAYEFTAEEKEELMRIGEVIGAVV